MLEITGLYLHTQTRLPTMLLDGTVPLFLIHAGVSPLFTPNRRLSPSVRTAGFKSGSAQYSSTPRSEKREVLYLGRRLHVYHFMWICVRLLAVEAQVPKPSRYHNWSAEHKLTSVRSIDRLKDQDDPSTRRPLLWIIINPLAATSSNPTFPQRRGVTSGCKNRPITASGVRQLYESFAELLLCCVLMPLKYLDQPIIRNAASA